MNDTTHLLNKAKRMGLNEKTCPVGQFLIKKIELFNEVDCIPLLQKLIDAREATAIERPKDYFEPFRPEPETWPEGDIQIMRSKECQVQVPMLASVLALGLYICGSVGSAKSTFLALLAKALIALGVPVVLISEKQEAIFKEIRNREDHKAIVVAPGATAIVDVFQLLSVEQIVDLLQQTLGREDSAHLYRAIAKHLESTGKDVSLFSVVECLRSPSRELKRRFKQPLFQSLDAVLSGIVESGIGRSLEQHVGTDLGHVLSSHGCLYVCTQFLNASAREFYTTAIMEACVSHAPDQHEGLRCVVLLDEGTDLLARTWKGTNAISSFIRRSRGAQIGLAVATHAPSTLDSVAKANAGSVLIQRMNSAEDIKAAASLADLTPEQSTSVPHLPVGSAIYRTIHGENRPVIVEWDPVTAETNDVLCELSAPKPSHTNATEPLLEAVASNPCVGVTKTLSEIGINLRQGKALIENHVQSGLLTTQRWHENERGAPPEFMFLTEEGCEQIGLASPARPGGVGIPHHLLQRHVVGRLAEAGYEATIDPLRAGKSADLQVDDVAIEICLSTFETEPQQALKNLQAGWKYSVCVCPTKADLAKLQRSFDDSAVSNPCIRCCLPKDLIKTLKAIGEER